jgi:hypothetical protein
MKTWRIISSMQHHIFVEQLITSINNASINEHRLYYRIIASLPYWITTSMYPPVTASMHQCSSASFHHRISAWRLHYITASQPHKITAELPLCMLHHCIITSWITVQLNHCIAKSLHAWIRASLYTVNASLCYCISMYIIVLYITASLHICINASLHKSGSNASLTEHESLQH